MPGIRAALGDDFNLRASRTVKIGRLVGGIYFEFLNTVDGRGHHARGSATNLILDDATRGIVAKGRRIDLHTAVHIIAVLASVEQKGALVDHGASYAAV